MSPPRLLQKGEWEPQRGTRGGREAARGVPTTKAGGRQTHDRVSDVSCHSEPQSKCRRESRGKSDSNCARGRHQKARRHVRHNCHANADWMSPSATHATQKCMGARGMDLRRARGGETEAIDSRVQDHTRYYAKVTSDGIKGHKRGDRGRVGREGERGGREGARGRAGAKGMREGARGGERGRERGRGAESERERGEGGRRGSRGGEREARAGERGKGGGRGREGARGGETRGAKGGREGGERGARRGREGGERGAKGGREGGERGKAGGRRSRGGARGGERGREGGRGAEGGREGGPNEASPNTVWGLLPG